jgi:hypothetical protein
MFGRLLNTLRYRLNRDLREWRKSNRILREYAWPWYQRVLIIAGTRPVRSPLLLFTVVLALSEGVWGYHALEVLLSANPPPSSSGIKQHFFTLWTVRGWWSKTGEEQGALDHGPCNPSALKALAFTVHEPAIKRFVGAWESLKNEFVEPEMAQRAGNEDEWIDRTVSSHVAASVMADILKKLKPEIVDVSSPLVYWQQIKIAAAKIRDEGLAPILFVAGRAEPRWLLEWTRSIHDDRVERPEDLRLVRDKQIESEGYVGSLNDIPVYVAPIGPGSSYLVPVETLDALTFTEFEDGAYVQVSFEPLEGKNTLINLRLSWRFQRDLKMRECWQLRYTQSEANEGGLR